MRSMVAALLLAPLSMGCVAAQQSAGEGLAASDTLRGPVAVVGSDPGTFLVIRPAGAARDIRLEGSAAEPLRRVSGAGVWVAGRQLADAFHVERFIVRVVNDWPINDGIIVRSNGGFALRRVEGDLLPIPDPPLGLDANVGARVWMTTPERGRAPSYGVIVPP